MSALEGTPKGKGPTYMFAGRPSGVVTQAEFHRRARALAETQAPGSAVGLRAAVDLMADCLQPLGYGPGLETLKPFLSTHFDTDD